MAANEGRCWILSAQFSRKGLSSRFFRAFGTGKGIRIKLKDFKPDLKRIEVQCIDFKLNFLRCGPAESSEMEINRIMANIAARGTPIGMCREGVERALRGHQPYMTFVEVCRCAAEGLDV